MPDPTSSRPSARPPTEPIGSADGPDARAGGPEPRGGPMVGVRAVEPGHLLRSVPLLVVLALPVAAGLWYGQRAGAGTGPPPTAVVTQAPDASPSSAVGTGQGPGQGSEAAVVVVHVTGAVVRPGVLVLPAGARVVDAVRAAGGALSAADLGALNLAAPLVDGGRLEVPWLGASARAPAAGSSPDEAGGPIDLNRADAAALESLPGVGPVLAGRIVAHRSRIGGFDVVEDLLDVPGIGEARLAELRELVVVR